MQARKQLGVLCKTAALVPNTWLDSTGLGFNTPNMLLLLQEYAHRLMMLNMTTLEPSSFGGGSSVSARGLHQRHRAASRNKQLRLPLLGAHLPSRRSDLSFRAGGSWASAPRPTSASLLPECLRRRPRSSEPAVEAIDRALCCFSSLDASAIALSPAPLLALCPSEDLQRHSPPLRG